MRYGVVAPDGVVRDFVAIDMPGPRLPHDMAITENYSILMDLPLVNDPEAARAGRFKLFFDREMPSRFAVIPRHGRAEDVRWFEADPCFIYHTVNAREDGDEIVLDVCRVKRPEPRSDLDGPLAQMLSYLRLDAHLHRYRFDLRTGRTTEQMLDDDNSEFPSINQERIGRPLALRVQHAHLSGEHAAVRRPHEVRHRTPARARHIGSATAAGAARRRSRRGPAPTPRTTAISCRTSTTSARGVRGRGARRARRDGRPDLPGATARPRADRLPRDLGARRAPTRRIGLIREVRLSAVLGLWQDRDALEALETARDRRRARLPDALGGRDGDVRRVRACGRDHRTDEPDRADGGAARGRRARSGGARDGRRERRGDRPPRRAPRDRRLQPGRGRALARAAVAADRHPHRETAEALRPLLAGERAELEGELVRTHGYRLRLPAPGSSLTIAAFGDAAVRVAARLADRMVINLCTPELAGRAARAARPPCRGGRRRGTAAGGLDPGRRRSDRGGDRAAQQGGGRPTWRRRDTPRCSPPRDSASWSSALVAGAPPRELLGTFRRALPRDRHSSAARPRSGSARREYRAAGVDEIALVPATAGDPGGRRTLEAFALSGAA